MVPNQVRYQAALQIVKRLDTGDRVPPILLSRLQPESNTHASWLLVAGAEFRLAIVGLNSSAKGAFTNTEAGRAATPGVGSVTGLDTGCTPLLS